MNFWLLAFGIGYPPKHPSSKSNGSLHERKSWTFIAKWQAFFLRKSNAFYLSRESRVGLALHCGRLPRRTRMRANIDRSSRLRGSSWRTRRLIGRLYPNNRLKLRAHRRGQFVNNLEKIHFGQSLRAPQQKRQRTRGFGSGVVFANSVE